MNYCQLAKDVPLERVQFPRIAEPKWDGVRVLATISQNDVSFMTRNGKEFNCFPIRTSLLKQVREDVILDGEFVYSNGLQEHRTKISGLVNSAIYGNDRWDSDVMYRVFDCFSQEDFDLRYCPHNLITRRDKLQRLFGTKLPGVVVHNLEDVNKYYEKLRADGYEGAILKDPNSRLNFKRDNSWVKLKAVKTADLVCIDIKGGTGKYTGAIGSLICTGHVEGIPVEVSVGSGLTDMDRGKHPEEFIGKTIEVLYNTTSMDTKTGVASLFLPRFVCVRFDKEVN